MISHWFTPEEKSQIRPDRLSRNSLWHQVRFLHDEEYTLAPGDLVLISFDRLAGQRIKRHLYQFSGLAGTSMRVVDGGLISQRQLDTLTPVMEEIRNTGASILLLGATPGFMKIQTNRRRMACMIRESNLDDDVYLRDMQEEPMFQYIGTQRHLVSESHLRVEGHLRLSDLKEDINLAEPCIRDADTLLFHCDSMNAASAGYLTGMSGSGLDVIEACQLFRYAGASQSIQSVGIYGYSSESDTAGLMANAIAQMIWYLLEGSALREDPERAHLTQYVVQSRDHEQVFHFYKSEISGRWWIQNKNGQKVPCSYKDYRRACEEDYSEVIVRSVLG
jgi:hypothetical protein